MNDLTQTLLRSLLKIGAGALVAKGVVDDSQAEQLIAIGIALAGVLWGVFHRRTDKPQPVPIKVPLLLAGMVTASILALGSGCAVSRQYATTTSTNPTNGVVTVMAARSVTYAIGDAKAALDKAKASAGKTCGVGVSGLSEESTTANIATNLKALTDLLNAAKP
jgi:uncharacterized low-complexity protein